MRDEVRDLSRSRALCVTLVALLVLASAAAVAAAPSAITVDDLGVEIAFPERMTFNARVEAAAGIARVTLEYGVDKLTCGTVVAKAFPGFEPGTSADVSWTWEMLQSGSEPPGATIWYRWRVVDRAGRETASEEQRVTWLDDVHDWQSISQGVLTFHWYGAPRAFAEDLLTSAAASLDQLAQATGLAPQAPIDMYIYADTADMRDAVLYEPGWTGGLAYPDQDIVIIGISPDQVDWGKRTEAHELTHVLVGHLTFSCLGSVPTWLNEGVAVYGEGGPDPASLTELDLAIASDRLISVRALSGGFSEDPAKADLSYSQSWSLVNFLVEHFGRDRLLQLFTNLRDGMPVEEALIDSHGFGLDEMEDEWRAAVSARPRRAEGVTPAPTLSPTPVPTYRPLSGVPVAPPTATAVEIAAVPPTTEPGRAADAPEPVTTSSADSVGLVIFAVVAGLTIGALAVALRRRND